MTELKPMYPGIPFSPSTTLTAAVNASATVIPVESTEGFPDGPNFATIGSDADGEVIRYATKTDKSLSGCTRGVEGTAKSWQIGESVARNFTASDYQSLIDNLLTLNEKKQDAEDGKGLSENDYTDEEKAALAGAVADNEAQNQSIQELEADLSAAETKLEGNRVYTLTHRKNGTVHTLTGIPTLQGIFTAQFAATADFSEGDTFSGYSAKANGEDDALPDQFFVSGDLVSVVVDTVNKKLGFKAGGSDKTAAHGKNDVTFYDYDGSIVASYTLAEAKKLNKLPKAPDHPGLTFQGWNWSMEKVKALTRPMNIGAMYITDDGKTRLNIRIWDKARSNVPFYFSQTVENGVTIDWGDGSPAETLPGTGNVNTAHQYTEAGDYTISLAVADGCELGLGWNDKSYCVMGSTGNNGKVYCNLLQSAHIGEKVSSISDYAFKYCYSLTSIVIPDGVTSIGKYALAHCCSLADITIPDGVTSIGDYAFQSCYYLASVSIPDGVTSIGSYTFYYCSSLASITIPDSVTSIGSDAFYACYSLSNITIPDGVTSIGDYAFQSCYSLASVSIPDGVTSIGKYALAYCYSLANITIPDSVNSIGSDTFSFCYSLASVSIPDGVTSIGIDMFSACYSLASVSIPDSVTSIGKYAFESCHSLSNITIPEGVTSIDGSAFIGCYGMAEYHLKPTTPPTLSNVNAFEGIQDDCIIYVPKGCLNAYQTATNWATYADYMREEA
ncbi:MAG: leucine-rich repeat domain-containing protein, partial [Negativibacillus sp.]